MINREVRRGNGFAVIKENNELTMMWPVGPFGDNAKFRIDEELEKKAFSSPDDAEEVMHYLMNGRKWIDKRSQADNDKRFLEKFSKLELNNDD